MDSLARGDRVTLESRRSPVERRDVPSEDADGSPSGCCSALHREDADSAEGADSTEGADGVLMPSTVHIAGGETDRHLASAKMACHKGMRKACRTSTLTVASEV